MSLDSSENVSKSKPPRKSQRYYNDKRLIASCIPIRKIIQNNNIDYSICMIRSNKNNDLIFPKGGWEENETKEQAAIREAFEEAGVKGEKNLYLGEYEFTSGKGIDFLMIQILLEGKNA